MKTKKTTPRAAQTTLFMANITLFAQVIRLIPRDIIQRLVKKHNTDKHSKGFNSWSHLVTMILVNSRGASPYGRYLRGCNLPQVTLTTWGCVVPPSSRTSVIRIGRGHQSSSRRFITLFWNILDRRACSSTSKSVSSPKWCS